MTRILTQIVALLTIVTFILSVVVSHLAHLQPNAILTFVSRVDNNREVWLVDTNSKILFNLSRHAEDDYAPTWSPDGRRIAFVSERDGNTEVYTYDTATGRLTNRSNNAAQDYSPQWMSSGQELAFVSRRDGYGAEIHVVNLQTGEMQNVSRYPGDDIAPIPAPATASNPAQILYTSNREGNIETFMRDIISGKATYVSQHPADDYQPRWSYDGNYVSFESTRANGIETYIFNTTDESMFNLGLEDADDYAANWSPTEHRIVFESTRNSNADIYLYELATDTYTNISNRDDHDKNPQWSPNGQYVAFVSYQNGAGDIIVYNTETDTKINLTNNALDNFSPQWSPNSTQVAFIARDTIGSSLAIVPVDGGAVSYLVRYHDALDTIIWKPLN